MNNSVSRYRIQGFRAFRASNLKAERKKADKFFFLWSSELCKAPEDLTVRPNVDANGDQPIHPPIIDFITH